MADETKNGKPFDREPVHGGYDDEYLVEPPQTVMYEGGRCFTPEEIDRYICASDKHHPEVRTMREHHMKCGQCQSRVSDAENKIFGVDDQFDKYK